MGEEKDILDELFCVTSENDACNVPINDIGITSDTSEVDPLHISYNSFNDLITVAPTSSATGWPSMMYGSIGHNISYGSNGYIYVDSFYSESDSTKLQRKIRDNFKNNVFYSVKDYAKKYNALKAEKPKFKIFEDFTKLMDLDVTAFLIDKDFLNGFEDKKSILYIKDPNKEYEEAYKIEFVNVFRSLIDNNDIVKYDEKERYIFEQLYSILTTFRNQKATNEIFFINQYINHFIIKRNKLLMDVIKKLYYNIGKLLELNRDVIYIDFDSFYVSKFSAKIKSLLKVINKQLKIDFEITKLNKIKCTGFKNIEFY